MIKVILDESVPRQLAGLLRSPGNVYTRSNGRLAVISQRQWVDALATGLSPDAIATAVELLQTLQQRLSASDAAGLTTDPAYST